MGQVNNKSAFLVGIAHGAARSPMILRSTSVQDFGQGKKMIRKYCSAIAMIFLLAFTALAQESGTRNSLTDLAYSLQPGKNLYLTGRYQGQTVNMVRVGALGVGKLTVYTGTLTDRVRLIIDDNKGLQEILAMDKGQRITVNRVDEQRIEYRLYAPDRSFITGSVLFRKDGRWLQGLMKQEAFAGYSALTGVADVSEKFAYQSTESKLDLTAWFKKSWQNIDLISTAHAEDEENLIKGFFSASAQAARERWGAPLHEMFKGSLVGASAFTVTLMGQTLGTGETIALGSALATATPFLISVGVGVAVGIAADRVYNWAEGKNLGGTASAHDLFNRLIAGSRFSKDPAPLPPAPSFANSPLRAPSSTLPGFIDMAEQQDKVDKHEFRLALETAGTCTRKRDFPCANEQLASASKLASSGADRQLIASARKGIELESDLIAEEASARTAYERQRAEAERQKQAEARVTEEARVRAATERQRAEADRQKQVEVRIAEEARARAAAERQRVEAQRQKQVAVGGSRTDDIGCPPSGLLMISSISDFPKACREGREYNYAYSDKSEAEGATTEVVCEIARNGDNMKASGISNISGCFCGKNIFKLNGIPQEMACWVFYDKR